MSDEAREERLKRQLRENLKRRKARARAIAEGEAEPHPEPEQSVEDE